MMEEAEKWVFHRTKNDIIQDLQPKYVLGELMDLGVVTKKQEKEIMSHDSEELQAQVLLNCIENGGREAYKTFIKCLNSEEKYVWLAELIDRNYNEIASINMCNLSNVLIKGGVPRLVPHAIQRKALLKILKEKLIDLERMEAGWVTIHGMGGLGKTMLAAAAVRDLLLIHHLYPHGVYWIKIGENISEDNLMNKMHTLCEKLDPASFCGKLPCDVEMAAERLRSLFGCEDHNRCLIVLDDVWSDLAIRNFDLGCRVMVTTRERSVMEVTSTDVSYVDLIEGFSLEETKQFFANTHKLKVEELPLCVSDIWNTARGYPLVMAIINSKVGEHSKNIDEAFNICLRKLLNRSLIKLQNRMPYGNKCVAQALEMSVETLGDLKELYFDFAIFPDNCYICREVLATLWRKDTWDVEEIMSTFVDKALAMQVPNGHHTTYYTIHDMYLQYMRETLIGKLHERHKCLINAYLEQSGGRYDKLPQDGYILLYLGYHLANGQMFDKFPEVFLDLKFILAKLSGTGPADLLGDFERYRTHINQDGKYAKKLKDFEEFVRSCTHLLTSPSYDMLQVALSQSPNSEVYQQATKICINNPSKSYFTWCNRDKLNAPCVLSTRLHPYGSVSISIIADNHHIVSGGADGLMKIWAISSGKVNLILKAHTRKITCLANYKEVNNDVVVVSSSADHTVRVWRITQQDFQSRIKNKVNTMTSCLTVFKGHTAAIISCAVHQNSGKVVSFDEKGVIQIWKIESGEVVSSWQACDEDMCSIGCCEFSQDGNKVVTAENSFLRLWDIKKQIPSWEVKMVNENVTSCHFSPRCDEVIATLHSNVVIYEMETGKKLSTLTEPRGRWLHSCSISSDDEYISAGNMENAVVVWDKKQHKAIDYLHGHKEAVLDVAFLPNSTNNFIGDGVQLVSAAADGTVMIWKTAISKKKFDAILKEIYSVQFDENFQPVIAVADMNNQIQVMDINQDIISGEVTSPKPNFSISCCVLSHKCDRVLFGSTTGNIQIFLVNNGVTTRVGKLQKEITCCAFSEDDISMAAGADDGNILIFTMDKAKWTYGHCNRVTSIIFTNNDLRLISCSFDGNINVWSVSEGSQLFQCSGHEDSVINCDVHNQIIVSASTDKTFRIWSGSDGGCLYLSELHSACVRCVKFNQDGNLLLSGDDSGVIRLWSISASLLNGAIEANGESTKELVNLVRVISNCANECWICDMCFSADGSHFVVCSDTINWWSTDEAIGKDENLKPLQTFPIRGRKTGKIFCSNDFETFITVDDTGVLYCLRLLKKY